MIAKTCCQLLKSNKPMRVPLNMFRAPSRHLSEDTKNRRGELVKVDPKQIFEKEFPEYFSEGKFITRISYVDYIDQALEKMKELGLSRDLNAYKELLRIFPPGRYHPKSLWDFGLFHAPQQICAIRLLLQMELNLVRPDKEVERLVVQAFSKRSDVWLKVARMNYWSMKGRNIDPNPLPERIPERAHELAKIALVRMLDDLKSVVTVTNTSSLPNVIDKTWIVYAQSPIQKSIIERLNEKNILHIEEGGLTYVKDKYLSYFYLKLYDDEETIRRRATVVEPDFDFNTLKVQFYGKPIKKKLEEMEDMHHVGDGHILATGLTGTSSQDSVLSWLKALQIRNPNLKNLNVVFKMKRPTMEVLDPNDDYEARQSSSST